MSLGQARVLGRHVGDADRQRAERAEATDLGQQRGHQRIDGEADHEQADHRHDLVADERAEPTPKAPSSAATSALRADLLDQLAGVRASAGRGW